MLGLDHDVMQVCRHGHVITDQLHADPRSGATHCERCGADTFHRCETCGQALVGVARLLGMSPIGQRRPPQFCASCGAPFPWTEARRPAATLNVLADLERLLRRVPGVIRELRSRHADRPPFRVEDQRDLEDLLRALLALQFETVRRETRTPRYSAATQTDFLLQPSRIALVSKKATAALREHQLATEIDEDITYYQGGAFRSLVVLIYSPEGALRDAEVLERAWSRSVDGFQVHAIIAE